MGLEKFESFSHSVPDIADEVMERLRDGRNKTVPQAVKQILANKLVTNSADVAKYMKAVGAELASRKNSAVEKEEDPYAFLNETEIRELEAFTMERQRGYDPED